MIPRFITFEGAEGCGKSTHIRILAESLRELGQEVVVTREPGGTPLCETIRGLLQYDKGGEAPCPASEVLLFLASRAQLVHNLIKPSLDRGAWVLCDRFFDSTFAYQGYGRGYDLDVLREINAFAIDGLIPGLTLLLDASPDTETERLLHRAGPADRFEREADDFHARLRRGFRDLAAREPERFSVVTTDRPVEESAEAIRLAVSAKYGTFFRTASNKL